MLFYQFSQDTWLCLLVQFMTIGPCHQKNVRQVESHLDKLSMQVQIVIIGQIQFKDSNV
jgi:hypothetical protein